MRVRAETRFVFPLTPWKSGRERVLAQVGKQKMAGMNILELVVVLACFSVLALGAINVLHDWQHQEKDEEAQRWLGDVERAMWIYVQRYHRLPCVDSDGDGYEDRGAGACTNDANVGGVPYATLGVPAFRASPDQRVRYGVWRDSATDLAKPPTPSVTDALQDPDGSIDFIRSAFDAAKKTNAAGQPQVAGMGVDGPRSACQPNDVQPVAVIQIQHVIERGGSTGVTCFVQDAKSPLITIGRFELVGRLVGARNP